MNTRIPCLRIVAILQFGRVGNGGCGDGELDGAQGGSGGG